MFRLVISISTIILLIYGMLELMLYLIDLQLRADEIFGSDSYYKHLPTLGTCIAPILASAIFDPIAVKLTDYEQHTTKVRITISTDLISYLRPLPFLL